MPGNIEILQEMADAMLPLFDNMPSVHLAVKDDSQFHNSPDCIAFYRWPNIVIRPEYAIHVEAKGIELKTVLAHELIHAWVKWKGLEGLGEFLNEGHNEWFVKKALEINAQKEHKIYVDVEYLLKTPEAIHIYNRVAGIWTPPHLREQDEATVTKPKPKPIKPKPKVVKPKPIKQPLENKVEEVSASSVYIPLHVEPEKKRKVKRDFNFNEALLKYIAFPSFILVILYAVNGVLNPISGQPYWARKIIPWVVVVLIVSSLILAVGELRERWNEWKNERE